MASRLDLVCGRSFEIQRLSFRNFCYLAVGEIKET